MSEIDAAELARLREIAEWDGYLPARSTVLSLIDALEMARGEGQRQYDENVEQIAKQAVLEAEIARWTDYAATLETERAAKDAEIARLREVLAEMIRRLDDRYIVGSIGHEIAAPARAALSISPAPDPAEAMRAKCEAIARERLKVDPDCWTIVRDIAALKGNGEGE